MRTYLSVFRTCAQIAAMLAGIASLSGPLVAAPGDAQVTPGEFVIEHPTLMNLGFEWLIDGDANRNASVDVSFRKQGETAWRKGDAAGAAPRRADLPAQRLQSRDAEHVRRQHPRSRAGHRLRGALRAVGSRRRRRTRGERHQDRHGARRAPSRCRRRAARTYHVYPTKWKGPKIEPAFEGIMCAYNYYCGAGDTAPGGRPRVKPGDVILVHAGTYAYHYEFYANQTTVNATTTFEGTYYLTAQGHARQADRHQGRRRRRSDPRRPRQLQPVQRQGGRLQLLRRDHLQEYRASRSGPARSSSPARKGSR